MLKYKKLPIAYQLYSVAAVIILIISFIFIGSYYMITRSLISNNIVYTTQVFNQFQANIEEKTELLESLLTSFAYNKFIPNYIIATKSSEKLECIQGIDDLVRNTQFVDKSIQEIVIEGYNGVKYYSNGKTNNVEAILKNIPNEPINYYLISTKLTYKGTNSQDNTVNNEITPETSLDLPIQSEQKSNYIVRSDLSFILSTSISDIWQDISIPKYVGRVSFVIDMDKLGVKDFKDEYDMGLFILDEHNNICAANQDITSDVSTILKTIKSAKSINGQEIVANGTTYILNTNYLSKIGVTILSITPKSSIINSISWVKKITFYLLLIALFMITIMFVLFKHNTVAPLKKFGKFMKEIENGSVGALKKQVELKGYQEIEEIANQFNNMITEVDSLTHRLVKTMGTLYDTEIQKKQAELLFLKSQINPHFLFNTLEVILGISYMEEAPKTAEMIKSLSKIFKYCVKGKDTVFIYEELNIIKCYIHIQQTRFYELFEAHYEFEEEILNEQIPKMLIQPIVENAITHGLEKKGAKGNVYIGGKLVDGNIKLWVEDDGIGLSEEKLNYMKNIVTQKSINRSDSIGFENVINRIHLIYGDKCTIELSSEENKGTRIDIIIPCL